MFNSVPNRLILVHRPGSLGILLTPLIFFPSIPTRRTKVFVLYPLGDGGEISFDLYNRSNSNRVGVVIVIVVLVTVNNNSYKGRSTGSVHSRLWEGKSVNRTIHPVNGRGTIPLS